MTEGMPQYSGVPRPATVLVNGDEVEVIKARETVQDVFHRVGPTIVAVSRYAAMP
jgi:hypothetical protein